MSAERTSRAKQFGLKLFRRTPAGLTHRLVRLVQPTYTVGAVAVLEYDGKVLALKQTHRRGYSLPGGLVDRGEQPQDAVRREFMEETGLKVDPGDVIAVVFDVRVRHCDVIFRIVCDQKPDIDVGSEAYAYEWLDLAHWPDADRSTERILRAIKAAYATTRVGRVER